MFTFLLRRGPAAEWAADNPLLRAGEPGIELDTGKFKIGDGVQNWLTLPYFLNEDQLADGVAGDSAYEVAVNNGFVGTEAQWLASLVGPAGSAGAAGSTGATGATGSAGISAYQVALNNGFSGTETQWLASLVGATGSTGSTGSTGAAGESVTVTYVTESNWPPAADSNPLHIYVRVPNA